MARASQIAKQEAPPQITADVSSPALKPEGRGYTVGSYQLIEKLGEGGMGAVYKGVDLMVERTVAIKMLRPEIARQPEIVERFRAEAIALAKLNHPNIATLYSFFRQGDEYFMVMEFVLGRTLEAVLRASAPLPIEQAVAISAQVLEAIEHAHSYGILHRDIKPANIMLTASGQAKVTDFGIARVLGKARMTREGCMYGTLHYMAPERIRGQEADIRSDLYSMGVVLYEMLSSHLPFEHNSEYELMRAHLEQVPPPFSSFGLVSIPPQLEMVVTRALAKLPEERFGTAGEFRSALAGAGWKGSPEAQCLAAAPVTVAEPAAVEAPAITCTSSPPSTTLVSRRPRWKLGAAGVVAVLLVLMGLILAFSSSRRHGAAESTTSPPAPTTQPTRLTAQPQLGDQPGAASALPESQQSVNDADLLRNGPPAQVEVTAPTDNADRAPLPAKSTPRPERRKAALKALDKDAAAAPTATKKSEKDRRTSSLEALKQ